MVYPKRSQNAQRASQRAMPQGSPHLHSCDSSSLDTALAESKEAGRGEGTVQIPPFAKPVGSVASLLSLPPLEVSSSQALQEGLCGHAQSTQ